MPHLGGVLSKLVLLKRTIGGVWAAGGLGKQGGKPPAAGNFCMFSEKNSHLDHILHVLRAV